MMKEQHVENATFYGLGIAPKILEILEKMKITVPTPIQQKAIPVAIEGKDLIGVAQTGTGKTLAFTIPIIQRFSASRGRCLVLTPTRELALQVDETFSKLAPAFSIRTAVVIGGSSMEPQIAALRRNPRVIIATPGRLLDHIERRTVVLGDIDTLVLDEADRMLDMGFLPDIKKILKIMPGQRQTMLFSATIPDEILKIAGAYMKLPIHVEVAPSGTTADNIIQELFIVQRSTKKQLLSKILENACGPILIFSRTKRGAAEIKRFIKEKGHSAAEIHSDRTLGQRKEALEGFKAGRYKILVATDIASRGIDVTGIELVVNYDLPEDAEQYVHRIGRTARAGHAGKAISFATPEQGKDVINIEKFIKTQLAIREHPDLPGEKFILGYVPKDKPSYRPRPGQGYRFGSGSSSRPGSSRPFNRHKGR
ncbi:MAG: DEAD/DEAH box helicase [Candidatus Omnitrophica bacterium]|nr:DEAD/DEAH box helicase [Candidatus Omnitrophota bacterium]